MNACKRLCSCHAHRRACVDASPVSLGFFWWVGLTIAREQCACRIFPLVAANSTLSWNRGCLHMLACPCRRDMTAPGLEQLKFNNSCVCLTLLIQGRVRNYPACSGSSLAVANHPPILHMCTRVASFAHRHILACSPSADPGTRDLQSFGSGQENCRAGTPNGCS